MQKILFVICALLQVIMSQAGAQSLFAWSNNHSHVDQIDDVVLLIGAEQGRNYVQALNLSGQSLAVALNLHSYEDPSSGALKETSHIFDMGSYAVGKKVFLDQILTSKSWLNSWSLKTIANEDPQTASDRDAKPFHRAPLVYPVECMEVATESETLFVSFSITTRGAVENILIIEVSQGCLALAAHQAIRKWIYAPKIEGGIPAPRENVSTQIFYQLSG